MNNLNSLIKKVREVMEDYKKRYPEVRVDDDYFPLKITEEWGECMQVYLMHTDRGRQKDKTKQEIQNMLQEEMADVFGYLLLFADQEGVNLVKALENKWFKYLS